MWPNSSLQNYSLASNSYEKVGLAIWDFYKRMDSNNGVKLQTNWSTIEKENCFSYLHNYIDLTNDYPHFGYATSTWGRLSGWFSKKVYIYIFM